MLSFLTGIWDIIVSVPKIFPTYFRSGCLNASARFVEDKLSQNTVKVWPSFADKKYL